jgi:hypothetical protein
LFSVSTSGGGPRLSKVLMVMSDGDLQCKQQRTKFLASAANFKMNILRVKKFTRHLDYQITKWVKYKFKKLGSYQKANDWLRAIKTSYPNMFVHWSVSKI